MDCTDARQLLPFATCQERELDGTERQALSAHLDSCPECAALLDGERAADKTLAKAMQAVPIPLGLQQRLMHRLQHSRPRRWLAKLAAAAAVLAAVGLGLVYWWPVPNPNFDIDNFPEVVSAKLAASAEKVEAEFAKQGHVIVAPRHFNYDLLDSFDVTMLQDRQVPRLVFFVRTGEFAAQAQVFILSPRNFNLTAMPQETFRQPTSGHIIEVLDNDGSGYRYVVVYTGGSLDPFRQRGSI